MFTRTIISLMLLTFSAVSAGAIDWKPLSPDTREVLAASSPHVGAVLKKASTYAVDKELLYLLEENGTITVSNVGADSVDPAEITYTDTTCPPIVPNTTLSAKQRIRQALQEELIAISTSKPLSEKDLGYITDKIAEEYEKTLDFGDDTQRYSEVDMLELIELLHSLPTHNMVLALETRMWSKIYNSNKEPEQTLGIAEKMLEVVHKFDLTPYLTEYWLSTDSETAGRFVIRKGSYQNQLIPPTLGHMLYLIEGFTFYAQVRGGDMPAVSVDDALRVLESKGALIVQN